MVGPLRLVAAAFAAILARFGLSLSTGGALAGFGGGGFLGLGIALVLTEFIHKIKRVKSIRGGGNHKQAVVVHANIFLSAAAASGLSFSKNALAAVEAIAAGQCKTSAYLSKASASDLFLKKPVVSDEVQKAYEAFARAAGVLVDTAPLLRQAVGLAPVLLLARTLVQAFVQNQRQEGSLPGLLIPHMARQVLESDNGVPEALCRMGSRLTHFLVDEFQDTSREQWYALRPLVEEALSRGGSLTWVGDVKQSIYGWRGGEPELFDGVFDDAGLTALAPDGQRDNLPYNWRSRREIVQHNNGIFGPLGQPDMAHFLPWGLRLSNLLEEMLGQRVAAVDLRHERTRCGQGSSYSQSARPAQ